MSTAHAESITPRAAAPAAPPAPPALPVTPIGALDPLSYTDAAPEFSAATLAILSAPVDPELVETRATVKDGPEKLVYVPWIHYQAVLLKAFGPGGYRLVPRGVPRTEGNVVTWSGALFVRAPGESRFQFIKEAKGECGMHGGMTAGNAAEGAQSDCLVKCCKGLGIFMELFDPRWRRAWEAKYRPTHQKAVAAAAWPAARSAPAKAPAGAGGAAPSAAPPSPASSTPSPSASTASQVSRSEPTAGAGGQEPSPAGSAEGGTVSPPAADTGEAATVEQKDAIRTHIKQKKWTRGFVRIYFGQLFGPAFASAADPLEALTQQQADAAYYLLLAHGKPMYDKLLADERAKGNVLA